MILETSVHLTAKYYQNSSMQLGAIECAKFTTF